MKLNELAPKIKKATRKRKGQGNSAGQGTYGGRGMNGQNARAGGGVRPGFEGGQTPLIQRMPKMRGFNNPNRVESQVLNLTVLEANFGDGEKVNFDSLVTKKLINKNNAKVKILGAGEITKKVEVEEGLLISAGARAAIEKAGGKVAGAKAEKVEKAKKEEKPAAKKAAK
ncbi:MAG: 50S ribosomal protein L15 [Candidatus Peregrinibacteria bacterium]|nr:50S ribosomal protein L15 [Candidatus Peregrinibacteria bacterium]